MAEDRLMGMNHWACMLAIAMAMGVPAHVQAQAFVPAPGTGSLLAAWQYATLHDHTDSRGRRFWPGDIDTHTLHLAIDVGIAERWALTLSLPYVRSRYHGEFAHGPDHLEPLPKHDQGVPHEIDLVDDGRWHGGWQDWNLRLRWAWREAPWAVAPYLSLGVPSHNYPFFGHSAIGTRHKRLELGVFFARPFDPPFERWYLAGSYGYSVSERVLGIQLRSSRVYLELGHHFSERVSARVFLLGMKGHSGLDVDENFPTTADDPRFAEFAFHHDRLHTPDALEAGLGFGWNLDARHRLFGHWYTYLGGANGHAVQNALAIGIVREF